MVIFERFCLGWPLFILGHLTNGHRKRVRYYICCHCRYTLVARTRIYSWHLGCIMKLRSHSFVAASCSHRILWRSQQHCAYWSSSCCHAASFSHHVSAHVGVMTNTSPAAGAVVPSTSSAASKISPRLTAPCTDLSMQRWSSTNTSPAAGVVG